MKILAIELSATVGQVACLQGTDTLATIDVPPSRSSAATLFDVLENAREKAGWMDWADVDVFAAGRGPGRYSGMRVALTAAQHLAMPGGRAMRAIDSGAAMAAEWAAATPTADCIWVIGDARRDRIWRGIFTPKPPGIQQTHAWELLSIAACSQTLNGMKIPPETLVISSDWDRLSSRMVEQSLQMPGNWQHVAAQPSAEWIGRLAYLQEMADQTPAPPVPIYLHPAVASSAL